MEQELARLLAERAIRRAIFTYCRGVDRLDLDLIRSIYHPDAFDHHSTRYSGPGVGFADYIADSFPGTNSISTSHQVTNCLIDFKSNDLASVESYFISAQSNGTDIRWMLGRYLDMFEQRGDEWKILRRRVVHDMNYLTHIQEAFPPSNFLTGRQDYSDPSYSEP